MLWFGNTFMILYSFLTPMNDSTKEIDIGKGFIFISLSVLWVYMYNSHKLSYRHTLSCQECEVRFIPILLATITVSLIMVVFFILAILYTQNVANSLHSDKKNEDISHSKNTTLGKESDENISEVFKLAMAERQAQALAAASMC